MAELWLLALLGALLWVMKGQAIVAVSRSSCALGPSIFSFKDAHVLALQVGPTHAAHALHVAEFLGCIAANSLLPLLEKTRPKNVAPGTPENRLA